MEGGFWPHNAGKGCVAPGWQLAAATIGHVSAAPPRNPLLCRRSLQLQALPLCWVCGVGSYGPQHMHKQQQAGPSLVLRSQALQAKLPCSGHGPRVGSWMHRQRAAAVIWQCQVVADHLRSTILPMRAAGLPSSLPAESGIILGFWYCPGAR